MEVEMDGGEVHRFTDDDFAALLLPLTSIERDPYTQEYDIQYELYARRLPTMSLSELEEEPLRLQSERKRLRMEMDRLAFENRSSFLRSSDLCDELQSQYLDDAITRVDSISKLSEDFGVYCRRFLDDASRIERDIGVERALIDFSERLSELVDIPILFDSCIQSQQYDAALDLRNFVGTLASQYPDSQIIQSIAEKVHASTSQLLDRIVSDLSGELEIPRTLLLITQLRKMNTFSETEIEEAFLSARMHRYGVLLKQLWSAETLSEKTPEQVRILCEATRQHLTEVSNHYLAAFGGIFSSTKSYSSTMKTISEPYQRWLVAVLFEIWWLEMNRLVPLLQTTEELAESIEQVHLMFRSLKDVGLTPVVDVESLFCQAVVARLDENISIILEAFVSELDAYHGWDRALQVLREESEIALIATHVKPFAILVNGLLEALSAQKACIIPRVLPIFARKFSECIQISFVILAHTLLERIPHLSQEIPENLVRILSASRRKFIQIGKESARDIFELLRRFIVPYISSSLCSFFYTEDSDSDFMREVVRDLFIEPCENMSSSVLASIGIVPVAVSTEKDLTC